MTDKKKKPPKQEEKQMTNEEQMMVRQSAPQPTAEDYIAQQAQMQAMQNPNTSGAIDGFQALAQVIGKEQVQAATQILQKYKEGKANLEKRIVANEQWYKLRHWECLRGEKQEVEPTSAWLFNSIANKHADAMDNFPAPNILPREEMDKGEAEMLSSIIPVILDQNDFEQTYSDVWSYKLKTGTGVYGVFWDGTKLNGLGDISIKKCDIINLFWESGITDIQKSRNLFHVELVDNDLLIQQYPQLQGKLGNSTLTISEYVFDDSVDTSNKSAVVDWYYKKAAENGKAVLHYCKYVNDEVLFATENDPKYADRGWYDDGEYPFVFDVLFRVEGTPAGFGYIDVGKSAQEYIDRGNQAIMQNMLSNTKPRHFIRSDGAVKEDEYADMTKDFVHVDGNLGQDSIMPIQGKPLPNIYVEVINNKINELKEVTGNRDISTGGTTSGVTAASAIAAMQEAGSKLSRDNIKASYRAYRKIIIMVIERIRQFYDLPRCFRIVGDNGAVNFIKYSNAGLIAEYQGEEFGIDMGYRIPMFDIEVTAQKSSPYSKMAQNELALQFYGAGFFNPTMAVQALTCLDMMDFDRKEAIMTKIAQNGAAYQAAAMAAQMAMGAGGLPDEKVAEGAAKTAEGNEALGGNSEKARESANTKNARQRVADSTSPT